MLEAKCTKCNETYVPEDEKDLIHLTKQDGTDCGGVGVITGEWVPFSSSCGEPELPTYANLGDGHS